MQHRLMRQYMLSAGLTLLTSLAASPVVLGSECIPDGGSASLCADIVLGPRSTMTAAAKEDDPIFDDDLGEPTISSSRPGVFQVCVTITNDEGDLSGPNGEVMNTGAEGDCIEVYLLIYITSPASGSITVPGGFGGSLSGSMTTTAKSSTQVFCPC